MIIYIYLKWKDRYLEIQIVFENRSIIIFSSSLLHIFSGIKLKNIFIIEKEGKKKNQSIVYIDIDRFCNI